MKLTFSLKNNIKKGKKLLETESNGIHNRSSLAAKRIEISIEIRFQIWSTDEGTKFGRNRTRFTIHYHLAAK